jgi:hypothetical protein
VLNAIEAAEVVLDAVANESTCCIGAWAYCKCWPAAYAAKLQVTMTRAALRSISSLVNAVNFGGKPIEPPPRDETGKPGGGPANRRAELWSNLKNALQGRFSLPDSDTLHADITGVGYKYTGDGRLLLEAKEDMRKRGMPSPDEGDAVALCFTEPEGSPFPQSNGNFNRKIEYAGYGYA